MTYTFKLARRLAVSRSFGMLSALVLLVACSGNDAYAPTSTSMDVPESGIYDWRPRESTPVAVLISPSSVTVETNQLIRFRANGRNRAGDTVAASVVWSTTGGTILPDGRFSAATVGTYTIAGRTRRPHEDPIVDTSIVIVVRRPVGLASIEITPGAASLTSGVSQTFSALGRLKNGSPVAIGAYWSASGGTIDPAGAYVAGDTAGTYRVIATNTTGTVADTAVITISAPPSLPAPVDSLTPTPPSIPLEPAPTDPDSLVLPPAPTPTLSSVILVPGSATLAPSTTRQFAVFGRNSVGDSIPVSVVYTATGGTVTAGGSFTAGANGGAYRIVATSGTLADTSTITVTQPLGSGSTVGIPFGVSQMRTRSGSVEAPFTMSLDGVTAGTILAQIAAARAGHYKMLLNMTGGTHSLYMTNSVFDMTKWQAVMSTYNNSTIQAAVAQAVADGVIVGNSVMDEPFNAWGASSWGPVGTMTKARVDGMCTYVKSIFPTLPVGVGHDHAEFEPSKSYRVCEFLVATYLWRKTKGDVTGFRDAEIAMAARDGMSVIFGMNVLDGGLKVSGCPVPETGGMGTFVGANGENCRMTPDQVRDWGLTLGTAGCGLNMWRYDSDFISNPDNQQAFKDIAARLAALPGKPCRRA